MWCSLTSKSLLGLLFILYLLFYAVFNLLTFSGLSFQWSCSFIYFVPSCCPLPFESAIFNFNGKHRWVENRVGRVTKQKEEMSNHVIVYLGKSHSISINVNWMKLARMLHRSSQASDQNVPVAHLVDGFGDSSHVHRRTTIIPKPKTIKKCLNSIHIRGDSLCIKNGFREHDLETACQAELAAPLSNLASAAIIASLGFAFCNAFLGFQAAKQNGCAAVPWISCWNDLLLAYFVGPLKSKETHHQPFNVTPNKALVLPMWFHSALAWEGRKNPLQTGFCSNLCPRNSCNKRVSSLLSQAKHKWISSIRSFPRVLVANTIIVDSTQPYARAFFPYNRTFRCRHVLIARLPSSAYRKGKSWEQASFSKQAARKVSLD